MQYRKLDDGAYVARLYRGDDPINCIEKIARDEEIGGAVFGIGAMQWAEIGYFKFDTRRYMRKRFDEEREMLSLSGNISFMNGEPIVHAHVVLGAEDFSIIGGHLFAGAVSATCEIIIIPWGRDEISRESDDMTGLALLKI